MILNFRRSKQSGISLLEVLLSLSIIAIILVMATRYYKSAQQSQQLANAVSMIGGIVTAQTQYASANNNAYAPDLKTLSDAGYLPKNFGTDPWGKQITLSAASPGYTINMSTLPSNQTCQILAGMINSGSGVNTTAACSGVAFSATYQ